MDFLSKMGLIPNYTKNNIALFNVDCLKLMEEMEERLCGLYRQRPTVQIDKTWLWKEKRGKKILWWDVRNI